MELSEQQLARYRHNIQLKEIDLEGQKKLKEAKVLVVGVGGLASPVLQYLASAGIGTLGIIDSQEVESGDLQRQVIHSFADIGRPKVISAQEKIHRLNAETTVNMFHGAVYQENILPMIVNYDFIIDATDTAESKYLINDACVIKKKPFSYAGVSQFYGQTMTMIPGKSACYRCLFPEHSAHKNLRQERAVLGTVSGVIGCIQATETIKFILGKGDLLTDRLLNYDAWSMKFHEIQLKRDSKCPVCGKKPKIKKPISFAKAIRRGTKTVTQEV